MSIYEQPAKSIFHPTDFSLTSQSAFAHALAIAVKNQASLTILHVVRDENQDVPWHDHPGVRETLERWGMLESGSSRRDIGTKLGIEIEKAVGIDKNIIRSIVGFSEIRHFDLIVMATDENHSLPHWMNSSVAIPVSQSTRLPTLFVPQGVKGVVSNEDGSAAVNEILLPVDHRPNAQSAMERIVWIMNKVGGPQANVSILYVGNEGQFPEIAPPSTGDFTWSKICRNGDASTEIVKAAEELNADLIVMVTEGKKGFWDAVRGSTVQQVLRKTPCPIFTMPSDN